MKKIIYFYVFLTLGIPISSTFAQEEISSIETVPLTAEQIADNTQTLILKIREALATQKQREIFVEIISAIHNKTITATWFFYVMLAEIGKSTNQLQQAINIIPETGSLMVLRKGLEFYRDGDNLSAARLIATISSKNSSLEYFVGKLYFSVGKQYQGAGYSRLGEDMQEAPYGLFYAGLSQNAVGNFSKAYSYLSRAKKMLLPVEEDLADEIHIHMAIAEFGNNSYKSALEIILPVYTKKPVDVIKHLDPGYIYTALKQNDEAKVFWESALKNKSIPASLKAQIRKNLNYNKRLTDDTYPPAWMRR